MPSVRGLLVVSFGAAVALGGCEAPRQAPAPAPVVAARAFLSAVKRGDCDTAWTLFSRATQADIETESAQAIRGAPYYAKQFSAKNLYCKSTYANRYLSYVVDSVARVSVAEDRAVVSVDLREPATFLIPGFFPTSYQNTPLTMSLVLEDGRWKIDRARARRQPSPWPRDANRLPAPPRDAERPAATRPPREVSKPPPVADLQGNLVRNGAFDGLAPWLEYHQSRASDRAAAVAEDRSIVWERTQSAGDGGLVGVYQDIDVDVSPFRELSLCLDVRVDYHTLRNTGWWSETHGGSGESPAKVVIRYQDGRGESHEWEHGFLVTNEPRTTIRSIDLIPGAEWRHFCFDLMRDDVRRDPRGTKVLPRPIRLGRVHLVGSGWDFRAAMTNVVLRGS